ncbi:MAG TPA: hypothetical protein VGM41_16515 [Chitinophagaceae bacterium]|jgi:hypothetical protein
MLRKALSTLFSFIGFMTATAQHHVHWKTHGSNYKIELWARIDKGWYLYSQDQPRGATAVPTRITFKSIFSNDAFVAFDGKPEERGMMKTIRGTVNERAWQYGNWVDFVQDIRMLRKIRTNILCTVTYQVCSNTERLPPDTVSFEIRVGN